MLTGGFDARYRAALAAGATASIRVDVTDQNGVALLPDIPISAGQVQATLQSRVARTLTVTTDSRYFPVSKGGDIDLTAPLAPVGNRIKAYRGIQYGDGTVFPPPYGFPVFYGCVEAVGMDESGAVTVTANDLANEIVTSPFEQPWNTIAANSINAEFQRVVLDALPNATFGTSDIIHLAVGQLTWATDRAQGLDDLLRSSGGLWYPLANGGFVQRLTPWTNPNLSPVRELTDGVGGTRVGAASKFKLMLSRTGVASSIVYISDRQDGTAALRANVRDTDPTSPTYFRGKFGKKPIIIQNQGAATLGQVNVAALNELRKAQALGVTVNPISMVPDPSLELGDMMPVRVGGVVTEQVVIGFTMPLRESGAMSTSVRAYTPLS